MAAPLGVELHLDLIGGLAGDMFDAALVDLRPDLKPGIDQALRNCGRLLDGVSCRFEKHNDGRLVGSRFIVSRGGESPARAHLDWRTLSESLEESLLEPAVKRHALGIFGLLAEAEARVLFGVGSRRRSASQPIAFVADGRVKTSSLFTPREGSSPQGAQRLGFGTQYCIQNN